MGKLQNKYVQPEKLKVYKNNSNNLCVKIEGQKHWEKVTVKRAFPYSDPEHSIILMHNDEEIGIIDDLGEVERRSRHLLEETLAKRYHIPEITRILSIEDSHNATNWVVQTTKGRREFEVQGRENFRRIKARGLIIIDVDANRFRIPAPRDLDKESQKLLDLHM